MAVGVGMLRGFGLSAGTLLLYRTYHSLSGAAEVGLLLRHHVARPAYLRVVNEW